MLAHCSVWQHKLGYLKILYGTLYRDAPKDHDPIVKFGLPSAKNLYFLCASSFSFDKLLYEHVVHYYYDNLTINACCEHNVWQNLTVFCRCENCVDKLFVRGSGSCPECNVPLRRNNFRAQLFEDTAVEKDTDIRKRVLKEYVSNYLYD